MKLKRMIYFTPRLVSAWLYVLFSLAACGAADYFAIQVQDDQTGRGVPLVELKTVNSVSWWTDSNGRIAFNESGLFGQEVYFHITSHGYEYPKDFFGNRGVKLKPVRGQTATVRIKRLNIAERLYRITGEGVYRDTALLGQSTPTAEPLLNGQVMGQDTVIATPYRNKIYWFWGDTDRVGYPLGNFGASGAVSEWPERGGLDPSMGVNLKYFVGPDGFSKPMCALPGKGLRWIEALLTVSDTNGAERLVARVATHRDLAHVEGWHLMLFDDEKKIFEPIETWDIREPHDSSHPFRARVNGIDYYYLYPNWRVKADLDSLRHLKNYEAFTCLAGEGKLRGRETSLDRDAQGQLHYSWKAGADRLHPGRLRELDGLIKPGERWLQLHDVETGAAVEGGRGSVYWNNFRQRWVMLMTAAPGEIWFAEGDTPLGPWVYARKVVSHDNYNFYNPTQHPFFDQEHGRKIYFEGTYTAAFSGAQQKTPRYDYNQIMYRLTLDDPRLALPAPVYGITNAGGRIRYLMRETIDAEKLWRSVKEVSFFALPPQRTRLGAERVSRRTENGHDILQIARATSTTPASEVLFLALPNAKVSSENSLDGPWQCVARTTEGGELSFSLELSQRGDRVNVASSDPEKSGSGTLAANHLQLSLTNSGNAYLLEGELRDGSLAGDWKQKDGKTRGTWSAKRNDSVPAEERSPAIVALYEYERADGGRLYATDPALPDMSLRRSSKPLCRVWRNPMTARILDPEARPVPIGNSLPGLIRSGQ